MSEIVKINNENKSDYIRWTPFSEGNIFSQFVKSKIEDFDLDNESVKEISSTSSEILSKCINPHNPSENDESTGLVIGEIQSGKTLSMTSVSAMAKDNGFGIIIVMSGNVTPLASQTAERIMGELEGRRWTKIINNPSEQWRSDQYLGDVKNFVNNFKDKSISEERKKTLLIVTFKNPARINQLSDLFFQVRDQIKDIPTLIIDDEADHHSLNTKDYLNDYKNITEKSRNRLKEIYRVKEGDTIDSICEEFVLNEDEFRSINDLSIDEKLTTDQYVLKSEIQTATHRVIKNLRSQFNFHTYLGYTATPNALALIDAANTLSPSFSHILASGSDYVGLNFFFQDNYNSKHIHNIEEKEDYKSYIEDNIIPPSLIKAVKIFVLSVACGISNKEDDDDTKNRSMIIHPHNEVSYHSKFSGYVKNILDPMKHTFRNQEDISFEEVKNDLKQVYESYKKQSQADMPSFDKEFLDNIKSALDEIKIIEFNAKEKKIPRIEWKDTYATILIGGMGLDRGYTIKGLTVSYLSRNLGGRQDDTILQRARFFGYHRAYEQYVSIFLNSDLQSFYQEVCESNSNLMKSIKEHDEKKLPFKDWPRQWFGTNAAQHQLTRRNLIRYNLNSFSSKYPFKMKYAQKINPSLLDENRKIFMQLFERLSGKMIRLDQLDDLLPQYKKWAKKNITLSKDISIGELYNDYFSKINFHNLEATKFQAVNCNLSAFANNSSFKDQACPVIFMNANNPTGITTKRSETSSSSNAVNTHAGRSKDDPEGYPGDQYIHYDYLTGKTGNQVGDENLTLQIYAFNEVYLYNEDGDALDQEPRVNVPYFNFYPAQKIWKDFVAGTKM
jgi:hypothetical protein